MVANICPMKPSGVQLSTPMVPPGRQTRTSSSAACWWCGANITPMAEITTSNSASSYGSASASAVCQVSSQALGGGRGPADVEQLGGQIGGGHLGPAAGGREGRGPGAGGDVEDPLSGLHVDGLDEDAAERCDDVVDHGRGSCRWPTWPRAWP